MAVGYGIPASAQEGVAGAGQAPLLPQEGTDPNYVSWAVAEAHNRLGSYVEAENLGFQYGQPLDRRYLASFLVRDVARTEAGDPSIDVETRRQLTREELAVVDAIPLLNKPGDVPELWYQEPMYGTSSQDMANNLVFRDRLDVVLGLLGVDRTVLRDDTQETGNPLAEFGTTIFFSAKHRVLAVVQSDIDTYGNFWRTVSVGRLSLVYDGKALEALFRVANMLSLPEKKRLATVLKREKLDTYARTVMQQVIRANESDSGAEPINDAYVLDIAREVYQREQEVLAAKPTGRWQKARAAGYVALAAAWDMLGKIKRFINGEQEYLGKRRPHTLAAQAAGSIVMRGDKGA